MKHAIHIQYSVPVGYSVLLFPRKVGKIERNCQNWHTFHRA